MSRRRPRCPCLSNYIGRMVGSAFLAVAGTQVANEESPRKGGALAFSNRLTLSGRQA